MLEADLILASSKGDRVASFEAHRDRMKTLHEYTQRIPLSDSNQPVKADHARGFASRLSRCSRTRSEALP